MERLLPWLRRSGWAYLAVAVALAGVAWWTARPGGGAVARRAAQPAPVARVVRDAPPPLLVHVAGEVRRPGVYRLGSDARVAEAVRRAGGPTRMALLSGLNLAAKVEDGQQVLVPRRVPAGRAEAVAGGAAEAPLGPVSLSSATAEQLDALDGIGPTLAARIVEWRAQHGGFARVEQLMDVPGFGQGRLDALRPHIVP